MIAPGIHRFLMMERVVHGRPAAAALAEEVGRLERRRVRRHQLVAGAVDAGGLAESLRLCAG